MVLCVHGCVSDLNGPACVLQMQHTRTRKHPRLTVRSAEGGDGWSSSSDSQGLAGPPG